MEYVADWQALLPEVEARGGTVLAFCSEPPRYARRVRAGRSLSFPVLGDPRNVLAHHLIDEGVVPGLLVVDRFDRVRTLRNQPPGNVPPATWQFYARHPYMSKYKEGVVQPCVDKKNSSWRRLERH